ncbi:hypothetical protein JW905_13875 [bacterium]|nr:hypothetical protein [candidate division CSSED10-310 bacterium]
MTTARTAVTTVFTLVTLVVWGMPAMAGVAITEILYTPLLTGSHGLAAAWTGTLFISDSYAGSDTVYAILDGARVAVATGFSAPTGLWIDRQQRRYVCDVNAGVIKRYSADWLPDRTFYAPNPWNLVTDPAGILYVTCYDGTVHRITESGGEIYWSGLTDPFGIAMDAAGTIFVSEYTLGRIRLKTAQGIVSTLVEGLGQPEGIRLGPDGRIWAADTLRGTVYMIDMDGTVEELAHPGYDFSYAVNLTQSHGDTIHLGCAGGNGRLFRLRLEHTPMPTAPPPTPGVTATSRPTSTPGCGAPGCTISMPGHQYQPGDPCFLQVTMCNPGPPVPSLPLFVILEIEGTYLFGPGFNTELQFWNQVLPAGATTLMVIEPFTWPPAAGAADGLWFHAGMTTADFSALWGEMDSWEFGWSDG